MSQDLKTGTLKDEFNKSILKDMLFQQKLNDAGIKKSYIKTALSDIEFDLNSCNERIVPISPVGNS